MTMRPEYASSIPPVSSPKTVWRRAAMASVFADTAFLSPRRPQAKNAKEYARKHEVVQSHHDYGPYECSWR